MLGKTVSHYKILATLGMLWLLVLVRGSREPIDAPSGARHRLELATAVAHEHELALERYGDRDGELLGARYVADRAGVDLADGPAKG